jgi:hypothetical protein
MKGKAWQVISAVLLAALAVVALLAVNYLRTAKTAETKLDCAKGWLSKAGKLHDLHLKDPTTTTEASQKELMDQIMKAYECVTGEEMAGMPHAG